MGVKLTFLSLWMPKYAISRELDAISDLTIQALKEALRNHSPDTSVKAVVTERQSLKSINAKRAFMAKQHTVLVEALAEALGQETAVKVGREALFKVGEQLGKQNRDRLGVGDNPDDIVKTATIMYRVLGIKFRIEWTGPNQGLLTVDHCALAKYYSELTCRVLSATDEGVMEGLNPNMSMKFEKEITGGCNVCTARIERRNCV
jgi:predicted ArsR family transcriptional regulator